MGVPFSCLRYIYDLSDVICDITTELESLDNAILEL